jgi:hypothetical protein
MLLALSPFKILKEDSTSESKVVHDFTAIGVNAYASTVHSATKKTVQSLMGKMGQDFSKVNTKSKGCNKRA